MTPTVHLAVSQLAVSEDKVTPGLLGFMVVVVLGLATWGLLRSMNKQLRRVDFEEKPAEGVQASSPENTTQSPTE